MKQEQKRNKNKYETRKNMKQEQNRNKNENETKQK